MLMSTVLTTGGGRTGRLAALALLSSVVLAACSSSDSPTAHGGAPPSVLASGAKSVSKANPVVVGVVYADDNPLGNFPETVPAARAAESYINSHGGIGGRALKVNLCNGKNNAASDVSCATRFVSSGAVTVYGSDALWGTVGPTVLAKAGVVNQTGPFYGPELTGPNAYPWQGETVTGDSAVAQYALSAHTNATCLYVQVPSYKTACVDNFKKPVEAGGGKAHTVGVPVTVADMSQYATQVAKSKDGLVNVAVDKTLFVQLVQSSAQQNYKPTWVTFSLNAQPDLLSRLGPLAKGVVFWSDIKSPTDTSDPDTAIFNAAMSKYQPSGQIDPVSAQTFSDLMTLKRLGDKVGGAALTRAGMPKILGGISGVQQFMGPQLDSTKHLPGLPHSFHTGSYLYQWNGKSFVPFGKGYYEYQAG
ncbi:ABC transporter substrate-binding protein [Streptomyces sp. NPDC056910]|uniref:ABC transporter substrate-binding protein n=1 Tax=Streptomyces sp. NPDC056910 TaxID=3345964 RepID=UPI0036C6C891